MWRPKWNVKEIWIGELDLHRVDLADITNIRPGTIGDIISGMNMSINLEDLGKICYALQCDISDILILERDSEKLDGEERIKFIMELVAKAREERSREAAERRRQEEEQRKAEEDRRIRETVQKILLEYGVVLDDKNDN